MRMIILTTKRKDKTTTLKIIRDINQAIDICIFLDNNNISYNIDFINTDIYPVLVNVFWNGATVYAVVNDGTKNINVSCGDFYLKEHIPLKDEVINYWGRLIGKDWLSLRSLHEYCMSCNIMNDYSYLRI